MDKGRNKEDQPVPLKLTKSGQFLNEPVKMQKICNLPDVLLSSCLLWINKTRDKDQTYIWVFVSWKTKNKSWGIHTTHTHWVVRRTGTPRDRDEVHRREVCECDGWVCDLDVIDTPSKLRVIRKEFLRKWRKFSWNNTHSPRTQTKYPTYPVGTMWKLGGCQMRRQKKFVPPLKSHGWDTSNNSLPKNWSDRENGRGKWYS
jgi:hypothetical protein